MPPPPAAPEYENPDVDHSVNVARGSHLGEFLSLSLWLALGSALLVGGIFLGMRWVAPLVPFSWEQRMARPVVQGLTSSDHPQASARQAWLQALAERLQAAMDWPADMPITVHWRSSDEPNAFATLGGHIFIHQGLLDSVGSENAVAMVMAHEMAHIKHRDPIVAMGSALTASLALQTLFGSTGLAGGSVAGDTAAALSQLSFSRRQERAADAAALAAMQAHYGHLADAEAFFVHALNQDKLSSHVPEFLQTHPDTQARLQAIQTRQAQLASQGQTQPQAPLPLPDFMQTAGKAVGVER